MSSLTESGHKPQDLPRPASPELAAAIELIAECEPARLTPELNRRLFTAAVRAFGRHLESGADYPPVSDTEVTATDAVRAAGSILEAVGLETFELALWQVWGGQPWKGNA